MCIRDRLVPDKPHESLCGKCDECIRHCPTNAIVEPFVIRSDLCIAYHTIENREENIPEEIEKKLNGWVAGCDICQDKCPWNKSVPFNNNIENRAKTIPENIEKNLNGWVAGCDICQDVCPWNKEVPHNNTFETTPKRWIKNLNYESLNWDDLTWKENLKGTTLKRIKPWMWKRNIQANMNNKKNKI